MALFDKKIHGNEFRLRLLVTDECNKNCSFCLNDFQSRSSSSKYLSIDTAKKAVDAYLNFMTGKGRPVITFSGGEPGLHGNLVNMIGGIGRLNNPIIKVVTNGLAMRQFALMDLVDYWHVGVDSTSEHLRHLMKRMRGSVVVQIVVTKEFTEAQIDRLIGFYARVGKIKLFVDFHSEGREQRDIEEMISRAYYKIPGEVLTRFTGKQENRGKLCRGCVKKCVTLKALWVFPDGTATACPQTEERIKPISWAEMVKEAYDDHLTMTEESVL